MNLKGTNFNINVKKTWKYKKIYLVMDLLV